MKKLNFLRVVLLGFSAFFLQTCKKNDCANKDRNPSNVYHNLSENDKSKVPYHGTDTLVYYSEVGDTIVLFGQVKKETFKHLNGGDGDIECPNIINHYYESDEYSFNGSDSALYQIKYYLYVNLDDLSTNIHYVLNTYEDGYRPSFVNNPINYNDSILIKGDYFYGTRFINFNTINLLYNYKYGFLQIKFEPGKTWTLKIQ